MKSKFKGRVPRTSGWETQPEFDKIVSDLDVSSLCYLKDEYNHRIVEYYTYYDLNNPTFYKEYKQILQRKKMVDEELNKKDITPEPFFDSTTGCVVNEYGSVSYSISFNDDETGYVYHHLNQDTKGKSEYIYENDDDNDINTTPIMEGMKVVGYKVSTSDRDRKDVYEDWNYTECLNEE